MGKKTLDHLPFSEANLNSENFMFYHGFRFAYLQFCHSYRKNTKYNIKELF
jgi:hypothetical protein